MTPTQLLEQFVVEARECLERVGERLLEVERTPGDRALLDDLFRLVHTLKGNCGLFEFKPLERVVHAAEDLLDRVRHNTLPWRAAFGDALLDAMDFAGELVSQIELSGEIAPASEARSLVLSAALRSMLGAPDAAAPAPAAPAPAETPPDWLQALGEAPSGVALRYSPEPDCFFKGEDPWRLALTTPSLQALRVLARQPWPGRDALAGWDCYRSNLEFVLASDAAREVLQEHFRYVPEQVSWYCPPPPPCPPALAERMAQLWAEQCALLERADFDGGTLQSVRRALLALLACRTDIDAAAARLPEQASCDELRRWARQWSPGSAPAMAPAEAGARADPDAGERTQRALKVPQEKVDRLMGLIGEMVVAKNGLPYLAQRAENDFGQRELAREIKAHHAVIHRIADEMQSAIMQVRMLPVGVVFQRFGRLVRDLSKKLGKEVQLVLEGEETEADKNIIEPLGDPLIHILRNSLDHGIERPDERLAAGKPAQGTIRIRAQHEGDRVAIEIRDDGAGIDAGRVRRKAVERGLVSAQQAAELSDAEAAELIFLPGFSTAETVSDLSGRGVGMDVVRTAVQRLHGSVALHSRRGEGTTIRLSLPLSMAVSHVMVIESAGRRFGVPMEGIVETVRVPAAGIHQVKQCRTAVLRGRVVPLLELNERLGLPEPARLNADDEHAVLVVRHGLEHVGLLVDDFEGVSDIILKPMEGVLAGLTGFGGTALMGDGTVLLVLNLQELL
jgi:two-component system chemotaxis sensor kinase CheA